jgi:hypothetical protein
MMADEKTKDDKPKKKYLDRFDTEDELVQAFSGLEKKLGEQGNELGQTRKQAEEALAAIKQYAEYVAQAKPIVDWYGANEQDIRAWVAGKGTGPKEPHKSASALLTPEEEGALLTKAEERLTKKLADQNAQWQAMAKQIMDGWNNQLKAHTDVWWRTMQFVAEPEKIERAKAFHEEAIKFADPKNFDAMKIAQDFLESRAKLAERDQDLSKRDARIAELEKAAVPSFGSHPAPTLFPAEPPAAKTKEERQAAVLANVQQEVGADAWRDFFPSRK